jgi:hypothetical protein
LQAQTGNFKLYPNPGDGLIHIDLHGYEGTLSLRISDITGAMLLEQELSGEAVNCIDTKFPAGIYFFTILQGQLLAQGKFLIH